MQQISAESAVYRDLEKLHRVIGYYEGQVLKPLEVHIKFIQQNLGVYLRSSQHYTRRIQYDLFLSRVLSNRIQIFEAEKPEITLLYSLFAEGIKSLVVLRDLNAAEMKDWCLLVRKTLIAFDQGDSQDLASVLWKVPYPNLRARIYNSLTDLRESRNSADAFLNPPEEKKTQSSSSWHTRDAEWELPSAENVERDHFAEKTLETKDFQQLKFDLKNLSANAQVPPNFRLSPDELERLSSEMECYDQNQVEFNLLVWNLSVLTAQAPGAVESKNTDAQNHIKNLVSTIGQSVVSRFHPGLILYIIQQIEGLDDKFSDFKQKINDTISETLSDPENERRLIESLADASRASVTKGLLPFLRPEQFPVIVDYYLSSEDPDGLVLFLKTILKRPLAIEDVFMSWGEERLAKVLPFVRHLSWDRKNDFLIKALRSRASQVVKQASYYIHTISIDPSHALDIYRKLPEDSKEVWMKSFMENPPSEKWKVFVRQLLRSPYWTSSENQTVNDKTLAGWIETFFSYLKEETFDSLEPWVGQRRWFFWPAFPREREAILITALSLKEAKLKARVQQWAQKEAGLHFQNPELKQRLIARKRSAFHGDKS